MTEYGNQATTRTAPADIGSVKIHGGFWGPVVEINRNTTIPHILDKVEEVGGFDALRESADPTRKLKVHPFRDSDVAKSTEAAAYALHSEADAELASRIDSIVELFGSAQMDDGYLNSYYAHTGIEHRWTNLRDRHEMYCAGHIIEAAVAHYHATGSSSFLKIAQKFADHIGERFGPGENQIRGYPGHEEIELALVKLYHATGEAKYLELASFFIEERGKTPHYFEIEAEKRGDDPYRIPTSFQTTNSKYEQFQAHVPVREQRTAEGHSVRACYFYSGVADIARETDDASLAETARALFNNIAQRRMYITGGIGSSNNGERFTFDYDLPNEEAYAETCAAIALVFFAQRMLRLELRGEYGDVMERALYNGVLGGVSRSGDRFFYANPLSFDPNATILPQVRADSERKPWYSCACCPPNIARLFASLAGYIYFTPPGDDASDTPVVAVNLFVQSTLTCTVNGINVVVEQTTGYPDEGKIELNVNPSEPIELTIAIRIPGWAFDDARRNTGSETLPKLSVCGEPTAVDEVLNDGYAYLTRSWSAGDTIVLELPMEVRRTHADPAVRHDTWLVALERGPIVYCIEEEDNGNLLADVAVSRTDEIRALYDPDMLGGTTILRGTSVRHDYADAPQSLYSTGEKAVRSRKVPFIAIPFAFRSNRSPGEMRVWLHEV